MNILKKYSLHYRANVVGYPVDTGMNINGAASRKLSRPQKSFVITASGAGCCGGRLVLPGRLCLRPQSSRGLPCATGGEFLRQMP